MYFWLDFSSSPGSHGLSKLIPETCARTPEFNRDKQTFSPLALCSSPHSTSYIDDDSNRAGQQEKVETTTGTAPSFRVPTVMLFLGNGARSGIWANSQASASTTSSNGNGETSQLYAVKRVIMEKIARKHITYAFTSFPFFPRRRAWPCTHFNSTVPCLTDSYQLAHALPVFWGCRVSTPGFGRSEK